MGRIIYAQLTVVNSTGALSALTGGSVAVFVNNSNAGTVGGVTITAMAFPGLLANAKYQIVVDTAADGLFYASGSQFKIVVTAGTNGDGVSLIGYPVDNFTLEAGAALRPTVAGRTLDVSTGGEAGLDWANIGSPSTNQALSATTISAVSGTVGSVTGNVGGNVTGSVGSVVGAVGSVTGNVGGNVVGSVASVTGNVGGNVVGSVASVTGNVGGNVVGSVGSVTGAVTVGTNNDKTGYALSQAGSQAIWDVTHFAESAGVFAWASATPRLILQWLGVMNTNKITQTATTQTMRNRADSGTVGTSAVSDDGTTFTKGSVT